MTRLVLIYLLTFLLPTAMWFAWVTLVKKDPQTFRDGPWFWLMASGAALVLMILVASAVLDGSEPGGEYVPPVMKDGEVVPGYFKEK